MPFPAPVISATLPAKSSSMAILLRSILAADQPGPLFEGNQQIANKAAARLVGKSAGGVELGAGLADQDLGFVQRVHVEKDAAPAQVVLRPRRASHAGAGADDRHGLAGKRLIGR